MTHFFQKTLFLEWAKQNKSLFSHTPYLLEEGKGYFSVGFEGVSRHIACYFFELGQIEIRIPHQKEFFDIIIDFDLNEEHTSDGYWICTLCRDLPDPDQPEPLIEYESRETLWVKHSFEPLAAWTRKTFKPSCCLYIYQSDGCTWAKIKEEDAEAENHSLQQTREPEANAKANFFKKLPVLTMESE